jgi:hypothetical protein
LLGLNHSARDTFSGGKLIGDFIATVTDVLRLLGTNTQRYIAGRSRPRPVRHVKQHPSAVYKG